ncbi:MAG: cbb3-type cytochrome oxidase assembly protein CcoS [Burkholderiales bacterium]|jgi:cbb3-type cytochrome oxidase maturation protein|nr:cbb3-type cytochrome oxidase assembly protein CcoS [Burkholderiales bacterium]
MEILWLLIPMSVLIVLILGCVFWWSVRSGQFDDLDGPAYRILADDDTPTSEMAQEEASAAKKDREGN